MHPFQIPTQIHTCTTYEPNQRVKSFNVHVREEVPAATHFVELKFVHYLSFRRFIDVFLGQINDLLGVHAAGHLQSPHFAEIVFVFVGDDVTAGEALDGDYHLGIVIVVDVLDGFLIVILLCYF